MARDPLARDLRPGDVGYDRLERIHDEILLSRIREPNPMERVTVQPAATPSPIIEEAPVAGVETLVRDRERVVRAARSGAGNPPMFITANPEPDAAHWTARFLNPEHERQLDDHIDAHRYAIYMGGRGSRIRGSRQNVLSPDHEQFLSEEEKRDYLHSVNRLTRHRERSEDVYKVRWYDAEVRARKIMQVYNNSLHAAPTPTIMRQNFEEVRPRHPRTGTPLTKATSKFHALLNRYDGSRGFQGIEQELLSIYVTYVEEEEHATMATEDSYEE